MATKTKLISGIIAVLAIYPAAAQAQIGLLPGTSNGSITFATDAVIPGAVVGVPLFTPNVVDPNGKSYGYLIGPGGPAPGVPDRVGAPAAVAGVAGNLPIGLATGQIGQFGGGSLIAYSNNSGAWFRNATLRDVPNAAPVSPASIVVATNTASFGVGAFGFNGTVGSFFAIGGLLPNPQPDAYLAASLCTIIDVFNPNPALNQTFYARTWLGFTGGANGFIASDGFNSNYANGNPALGQPTTQAVMQFGNFGANSFSSAASVITSASFVPGTVFTVTNYLTMIANIGPGPAANMFVPNNANIPPGVGRPDFGGNSATAPEPATLGLLAMGIGGAIIRRRKA